jgi:hypothetical protein
MTGRSVEETWRAQGINARRFIDFLMIESMARGGQQNGKLKAPNRQLRAFGIGNRHVVQAIREAESLGLVDCHLVGMRGATTYALTWLRRHDGTPASNRWCAWRNPALAPRRHLARCRDLPGKRKANGVDRGGKAIAI